MSQQGGALVLDPGQLPANMKRVEDTVEVPPDQLRPELKRLRNVVEQTYFRMGALLHRVITLKSYLEWGYNTFGDYTDAELGFKDSKGYYLSRTWEALCVKLGVQQSMMEGVGLSHAKAIAQVATAENVGEWIERAKKVSVSTLVSEVKASKEAAKGGDGKTKLTPPKEEKPPVKKVFHLFPAQEEMVEKALAMASKEAESEKPGHLLTMICTEYAATNLNLDEDGRAEWYINQLKAQFPKFEFFMFTSKQAAEDVFKAAEEIARKREAKNKAKAEKDALAKVE